EEPFVMHLQATVDERAARRVPAPGEITSHRHVVEDLARWTLLQDESGRALGIEARCQSPPEVALRPVTLEEAVRPDVDEEEEGRGGHDESSDSRRPARIAALSP